MKKLILVLLLFSIISLISQDKEPNLWKFRWGHSTDLRTFVLDSFEQKTIQTGFQWSGSAQMNNALFGTVRTGQSFSGMTESLNTPLNLIFQPVWFAQSDYYPGYFGAVMMNYEPTLPLDGTNEGEILRPNDTTDPVFGFRYRRGTVSTNPSNENYSRLVLKTADKPSYGGDRVLEDIWPQPRFETREWEEKSGQTDNYLGRKWYLAINLRRLNPSTETIKDDSVVIKIRMPFTYWDDVTDEIKFNKLPINHQDSVEELYFIQDPDSASLYPFIDSRGYAQLMHIDTSETIEITRRMIPTLSDNSENITIYAEFHTNGNDSANTEFSQDYVDNFIKDIDIEVDYLGGLDVAIDYIRLIS